MNRKYNDLAVELAKKMRYEYNDITWMLKALDSSMIQDKSKNKHYNNTPLAVIGSELLDFVIADHYYEIADASTVYEKTKEFKESQFIPLMSDFYELAKYSYNEYGVIADLMKNDKVPFDKIVVFKAIAGAVYKDKGFKYAEEWITGKLFK